MDRARPGRRHLHVRLDDGKVALHGVADPGASSTRRLRSKAALWLDIDRSTGAFELRAGL
jgi:hypothetical protein